ncbi:MAG: MFS transporter [Rhizobiales bacterium]|nr:MFS transporter [Hyphomicrobiales bacterium]
MTVVPRPLAVDEAEPPHPSKRSLRGLDWFIFFVADIQTGFGPFIAVYLTSQKWTQVDIGLVLSTGGLIALLGQMPGGALVDAARSERLVAGLALSAIATAALAYAFVPVFPVVLAAAALHAAASCVLGPCIVAMSLGLVGHAGISERLGRNARFAAIGNGMAAAAMGAVGYLWEPRAVFLVTAILLVPTLLALSRIRPAEVDPDRAHGGTVVLKTDHAPADDVRTVIRKRPLLILAGCALLFHLANGSMLPLMGSVVTMRSSQWATVTIAACIVVPQIVVALMSPWVGHYAQIWGRLPFLRIAFGALVFRALLFAVVTDPYLLVAVQILDGITAAGLGVMVPLMIADIMRGTGRFNLAQGIVGTAVGIGASISPTLAGSLSDHFGSSVAFFGLAAVAAVAFTAVWALMPETRASETPAPETRVEVS